MDKRLWTDDEIALLCEKYPTCGSKIPGLNRTAHQILKKAGALGLRKDESIVFRGVKYDTLPIACKALGVAYTSVNTYKNKTGVTVEQALEYFVNGGIKAPSWQSWEDAVIREEYPSSGSNIEKLAHRSPSAIISRAIKLGVKCDRFQHFWSEEDIQLLQRHYEDDCDISSLIEKFGSSDVKRKSVKLGLIEANGIRWEPWEDALLMEKYRELGVEIPELRGRRSRQAITSRAGVLGVSADAAVPWSDEELSILREKYPECGTQIPELSLRSVYSIRGKASELGISYDKFKLWTDEQVSLLKSCYPTQGVDIPELQVVFTDKQIESKARTLHIRRETSPDVWTAEEDAIIMEKYPSQGSNIPELVGRTASSITKRAMRIGVRDKRRVRWSNEHLDILRSKYPVFGPDIPELLKVYSRDIIIKKAGYIGVKREGRNIPWSPEEERIIAENYGEMTAEELLSLLPGRTQASIYAYINKRGMVKEVAHSQAWKDKAAQIPQSPPDGYTYVRCRVCGKVFVSEVASLSDFSHAVHKFPIPDGWFAPAAYTKVV